MSRQSPGRLDSMLSDGTLCHLAYVSKNQSDLARRCGITPDAFISWRIRFRVKNGVSAPTFEELQRGLPVERGVLTDAQNLAVARVFQQGPRVHPERDEISDRGPEITDRDDFDVDVSDWDDEPTQPNAQTPTVVGARNPPDFSNWPEALNDNWRTHEQPASSRKLTREDCPDGSLILWASDVHIPIHNDVACRLMVECAERSGVSRVIAGGDILDLNCLSKHAKESRRTVEHATILEEVEPGRWLLDWFATKPTDYILGNHEDRLKRFVDENPAFHGSLVSNFAQVTNLPSGINVLPQGGEVRLGSLSARHLDAEFKNSSGGKYPAQRVLEMLPDQSTIGGHVHRITTACRTTRDEHGINRTHKAWTMGHMSHEHMHSNYVSSSPNWQEGFGMIRVCWEGERPRFSVYQIEVLRDRNNRPMFEWDGYWYL
jgi:hypothetical protein